MGVVNPSVNVMPSVAAASTSLISPTARPGLFGFAENKKFGVGLPGVFSANLAKTKNIGIGETRQSLNSKRFIKNMHICTGLESP